MSHARLRGGRGKWKAVGTVVVALAIPATGSAVVEDAPARVADAATKVRSKPHKKKKRKPTIEEIIRDQFGERADDALRVARCESKLDPKARSRSGARGVFQIMPVHTWRIAHVGGKDLADPRTNIRVARDLHKDEGWRPWVCARILGLR